MHLPVHGVGVGVGDGGGGLRAISSAAVRTWVTAPNDHLTVSQMAV
jgi:hypothetical protein